MIIRRLARIPLPYSRRLFSNNSNGDLSSAIAELNKDMKAVFGEAPPATLAGSSNNQTAAEDFRFISTKSSQNEFRLSHVGGKGEAQWWTSLLKKLARESQSQVANSWAKKCSVWSQQTKWLKGDVLSIAKIAGISGAKQTSNLIPLCHNISLTHVRVDLALNPVDFSVEIEGEAASTGKTGVEMEARTAVAVAGLTVYDMCKAASKDMCITDVRLEHKVGGKSRDWSREK